MIADPLLWLLQANDSGYPSGAYAHSSGLEEMVACGAVSDARELEQFLQRQIVPALLTFEVPLFGRAHAAAVGMDRDALLALDAELDAWRIPAELRDASRRIGSQRLELLATLDASPFISGLRNACPRCHHLVVCALELAALPVAQAARAYAYQAIAGLTSASLKLIRIGQSACQQILRRTLDLLGSQLDAALLREPDGWFNPMLEIASLRHARAHARLFIS
ncbi:MAG: urease accessory UreF family protein [Verrucomicrobiota bacterium]